MAFNFNWSPLAADENFYRRARDLLTAALNKSPKPPIIVDDILVTELNLGSVPPELEILEIGDLAEDRFRGIFKMCYSGDAFLTLKTRVQANPLSTYIDSTPSFISPAPLAAASGLTIPLSITLSEIRLSAFIILVFSKQKGLTIVFRNDPLESLKVSSTFDSIQFVRDYLQRTIEGQLRVLMMDQLPAIIHRLSLQLWCGGGGDNLQKDNLSKDNEGPKDEEHSADPLSSPPLDPVDANGNTLDDADISKLSLDGGPEVQSMFAKLNLVSSFGLGDFNRTLMALSPSFRDVVFRGWNEAAQSGLSGYATPTASSSSPSTTLSPVSTPSHSKSPSVSYSTTSSTYSFSDSGMPPRPSIHSQPSGLSLGHRSRSYGKKKKTRVVNLRRKDEAIAETQVDGEAEGDAPPCPAEPLVVDTSRTASLEARASDRHRRPSPGPLDDVDASPLASPQSPPPFARIEKPSDHKASADHHKISCTDRKTSTDHKASTTEYKSSLLSGIPTLRPPPAEALDQQWIMKMAGEIARRMYDEKRREWEDAPPAYDAH